jgi:hypothetical protein
MTVQSTVDMLKSMKMSAMAVELERQLTDKESTCRFDRCSCGAFYFSSRFSMLQPRTLEIR